MGAFRKAVEALFDAADAVGGTPKMAHNWAEMLLGAADGVTEEEYDEALERLAPVLEETDRPRAAAVALACGGLVERGGNPTLASKPILALLPDVLADALAFAEACLAAAEEVGADTSTHDEAFWIDKYGPRVARKERDGAAAWAALEPLRGAALAMLARSAKVRRQARAHETLLTHALNLSGLNARAKLLAAILQVIDEELLVLHPPQRRGYRVRISGIADNLQLNTLLADALIGPHARGLLQGKRPDPRTVAAARDKPATQYTPAAEGYFNLWAWHGLKPNRTLPEPTSGSEHWVWLEGTPADIPEFEGQRLLLLGPPPMERRWTPGRRFPAMPGELTLLETLAPDEVEDWLNRLARARK
jgi:hypothetical protein